MEPDNEQPKQEPNQSPREDQSLNGERIGAGGAQFTEVQLKDGRIGFAASVPFRTKVGTDIDYQRLIDAHQETAQIQSIIRDGEVVQASVILHCAFVRIPKESFAEALTNLTVAGFEVNSWDGTDSWKGFIQQDSDEDE